MLLHWNVMSRGRDMTPLHAVQQATTNNFNSEVLTSQGRTPGDHPHSRHHGHYATLAG